MKPVFLAPRGMLARKPAHGAACNRCGLCCMATLCSLGQHIFQREAYPGPCPALRRDGIDSTYSCDVAANPQAYAQRLSPSISVHELRIAALHLIGAGDGCDARFNGEPQNHGFSDYLDALAIKQQRKTKAARKLWGMP